MLHPSGTNYCTRTSGFSSAGCIAHCDVPPLTVVFLARCSCEYRRRREQFGRRAKKKISKITGLVPSLNVDYGDDTQIG